MWIPTAEELAVEYLVWLRDVRERPPTSYGRYARVLKAWLEWCEARDIDATQPGLVELERFMTRLRANGRKGKPATQKMDATVLRIWFDWMRKRDYITKNDADLLYAPKVLPRRGRPVPDNAWIDVWSRDLSPLTRTALGLGYFAGMRTFEIEFTPRVNLGSDLVTVTRKGGKVQRIPWLKLARIIHHRLPHLLPDPELLIGAARHVRVTATYDRLFPFEFESTFYKLFGRTSGNTPHMLRHSTATNLLRSQVNMPMHLVQEYMGHANINDTRSYVEETGSKLEDYFPELASDGW